MEVNAKALLSGLLNVNAHAYVYTESPWRTSATLQARTLNPPLPSLSLSRVPAYAIVSGNMTVGRNVEGAAMGGQAVGASAVCLPEPRLVLRSLAHGIRFSTHPYIR